MTTHPTRTSSKGEDLKHFYLFDPLLDRVHLVAKRSHYADGAL